MRELILKAIILIILLSLIACGEKNTEKSIEIPRKKGGSSEVKDPPVREPLIYQEPVVYKNGGIIYAPGVTVFELTSEDEPTKEICSGVDYIELSIDGGEYIRYTEPVQFKTEGKHTIKYRAVDKVGNKEPLRTKTIVIDDTVPSLNCQLSVETACDGIDDYVPSGTKIIIDCKDALAGVKSVSIDINNSGFIEYVEPVILTDDGEYIIKYKTEDFVGNVHIGVPIRVIVDGTPPQVEINPSGKLYTYEDEYNIVPSSHLYYLSASDSGSGVVDFVYRIDGGELRDYEEPINLKSVGGHTIETYAVDRVGNKSRVESLTVFVDPYSPLTEIEAFISRDE
jgi:hypothetical protein